MIRAYLAEEQEEWDMFLGCLAGAYRATLNEATHFSPNRLCLGLEIRLLAHLLYGQAIQVSEESTVSNGECVETLKDRMLKAHDIARKYLQQNAKRNKEIYDTRVVHHNYEKGELEKRYSGPFVIKNRLSVVNFEIQMEKEGTTKVLHHNKLKAYEGNRPSK